MGKMAPRGDACICPTKILSKFQTKEGFNMGKIPQFPRICAKCHRKILDYEEAGSDIDDNLVCLDCFFAPLNEARDNNTVIAEVDSD